MAKLSHFILLLSSPHSAIFPTLWQESINSPEGTSTRSWVIETRNREARQPSSEWAFFFHLSYIKSVAIEGSIAIFVTLWSFGRPIIGQCLWLISAPMPFVLRQYAWLESQSVWGVDDARWISLRFLSPVMLLCNKNRWIWGQRKCNLLIGNLLGTWILFVRIFKVD